MKKSSLLWVGMIFLLFLNGCSWEEISSGHGYGGLVGNLYLGGGQEGILPDIEIRVESSVDYDTGSVAANPTRVDYQNLKTHGLYKIDGLPEGTYSLKFYIKDYSNGYAYSFVPEAIVAGDDTNPNPDSEARADAQNHTWNAYIRKNEMYIMPDIYLHKRELSGYGTVRGKVYSLAGNVPVEGVQISAVAQTNGTAPASTAITDANGEYILSRLQSGATYNIIPSADGFQIMQPLPTVVIAKDIIVQKDLFITPQIARITGQINFSGRYAYFFSNQMANAVKIRCDSNNFTGDPFPSQPTIPGGTNTFSFNVPCNLPKYTITSTGTEPHFSGTIKTLIPSLSPGQNYIIPEETIIFEYLHKTIIVDASGVVPPANSMIYCKVTGTGTVTGVLDSFEMHPNGANGYRAYIDMPYGLFQFEPVNLDSVVIGWTAAPVQYNIDDSVERVLVHILGD